MNFIVFLASTTLSPNTPLSSRSPHSPHSSHQFPQPGIVSSQTPSPTSGAGDFFASGHPVPAPSKSPDTISSKTASTRSSRLNSKDLKINTSHASPAPPAPNSPQGSDYSSTGLAYDQETESALSPRSEQSNMTVGGHRNSGAVQFPQKDSPQMSIVGLPTRSASSASTYSYASRTTVKSAGVLDTLFENERSPQLPTMPLSPRSPKLPMRAKTTPTVSTTKTNGDASDFKRPRQCTKCTKSITDGRWIRAEGAGVLCERCWKTLYLPKVRCALLYPLMSVADILSLIT